MTKVEAIKKVLEDNKGVATWDIIYKEIKKYYPNIDASLKWKEGIRGVLYREIRNNKSFKKIGLGVFALLDYKETNWNEIKEDKIRMHSYIEGVCIELGNFDNFHTYTADLSAKFNDLQLLDLVSLKEIPQFTYDDIITEVKRIDVIWFNKNKFKFPKIVYEVVDSLGTMENAFSRSYQLFDFTTIFFIVGRAEFEKKFHKIIKKKPYNDIENRYKFISYDRIIKYYETKLKEEKLKFY